MKKKLILILTGLLVVSLAAAGYVYHNFTIQSDVYEPFSIEYAIIGDAGNWDGITTCSGYEGAWNTYENGFTLDVQGLYAGEGRMVCARIHNLAEANIDYTISNTILNEDELVKASCIYAFGETTISGTATAQAYSINGLPILVSQDAQAVSDCLIKIQAKRG
jgi:hypothetical protein